ncbi:hypothetical protein MASR2M39_17120 [Ignavibacteriales bacterium]
MKKRFLLPIVMILALIFSACSTTTFDSDYKKEFNFSTLKVFTIYPSTALKSKSPLIASALGSLIDSSLIKKGYSRGAEVHDFVVTFYTETEIETSYGSVNFDRWKGFWSTKEEPLFAAKGLIVIDIIDGNTGDVVWRGWDNQLVGREEDPKVVMRNTVERILTLFPPQN